MSDKGNMFFNLFTRKKIEVKSEQSISKSKEYTESEGGLSIDSINKKTKNSSRDSKRDFKTTTNKTHIT